MVDPVPVCWPPYWCVLFVMETKGIADDIGLNHLPVVEKAVTTPTGIPHLLLIMGIFEVTGRIGV